MNCGLGIAKNIKIAILVLILIAGSCILTGCGSKKENKKPLIVCSIYPEYDWLVNVLGECKDDYEIRLILNGDTDLHSYQPVARDIAQIIDCEMLIYVGGEGDSWIEDALNSNKLPADKQIIKLLDEIGENALDEEIVEGMDDAHGHDDDGDDDEKELDEHIWLSVSNAELATKVISDRLGLISPEKADVFSKNCEEYISKLEELNKGYKELAKVIAADEQEAGAKQIIVADRFPFRYLVDSLSLNYYAAFSGCSADSEASFRTVSFLAEKLKESSSKKLYVLENSDKRLAESIIKTSELDSVETLMLDSMQMASEMSKKADYCYIKAMEYNLQMLEKGLK